MSYSQLKARESDNTAQSYVNSVYDVNKVSEFIQDPNGRILKINNNPTIGNTLTYTQQNDGTITNPDFCEWTTVSNGVTYNSCSKTNSTSQVYTPNISNVLLCDTILFSTNPAMDNLPNEIRMTTNNKPFIYSASLKLTVGNNTAIQSVILSVFLSDGPTVTLLSQSSVTVLLVPYDVTYAISCSGIAITPNSGTSNYHLFARILNGDSVIPVPTDITITNQKLSAYSL